MDKKEMKKLTLCISECKESLDGLIAVTGKFSNKQDMFNLALHVMASMLGASSTAILDEMSEFVAMAIKYEEEKKEKDDLN